MVNLRSESFHRLEHPDMAIFSAPLPTLAGRDEAADFPGTSPRRPGGGAGPAVLPVLHQHLRHHQGDRGTDHGTAAGLHGQRAVRPPPRGEGGSRDLAAAAGKRSAGEEVRVPGGMPAYLANLYEVPLLTREQEAHLFRKMNYLKYKARRLRETLDVDRPRSRLMGRIEKLYDESVAIKNQIIRPTFGWWSRLPSGTSVRRRTSSSLSATGTCR